jgi:hypothetical protein
MSGPETTLPASEPTSQAAMDIDPKLLALSTSAAPAPAGSSLQHEHERQIKKSTTGNKSGEGKVYGSVQFETLVRRRITFRELEVKAKAKGGKCDKKNGEGSGGDQLDASVGSSDTINLHSDGLTMVQGQGENLGPGGQRHTAGTGTSGQKGKGKEKIPTEEGFSGFRTDELLRNGRRKSRGETEGIGEEVEDDGAIKVDGNTIENVDMFYVENDAGNVNLSSTQLQTLSGGQLVAEGTDEWLDPALIDPALR